MGIMPAVLSFHSSWAHLKEISGGRKELGSGTVSSHSGLELPSAPSAQLPGPHKGVNVAALRVTQLLSALAAPASALPP